MAEYRTREIDPTQVTTIDVFSEEHMLSNCFMRDIVYNNVTYNSIEQAYHAHRYDPVTNKEAYDAVMAATSGVAASEASAKYKHETREDWDKIFVGLMLDLMMTKMEQHPDIKEYLLSTGDAYLYEEDPKNRKWGMQRRDYDGLLEGGNFAGRMLMVVRWKLSKKS